MRFIPLVTSSQTLSLVPVASTKGHMTTLITD